MIYTAPDTPPFNQTANDFSSQIFLVANTAHHPAADASVPVPAHFDSVIPRKWANTAAMCQCTPLASYRLPC